MNNKNVKKKDALANLLKQELMEVPSDRFSDQLLNASITSYKVSYSQKYQKDERLGKAIIAILIFFNLTMLVKLNPLGVDVAWMIGLAGSAAFIAGCMVLYLTRMNGADSRTV